MRAHTESVYDEYEKEAMYAIWREKAHREKKPKASDLFKRLTDADIAKSKAEESKRRTEETMKWLAQFEEFRGKEGVID